MAFVNSIRTYSEKRLIGYTREQLFDVVADVENYHLFVPACKRSDVIFKSRDRIQAKLEIGIKPLLESYTSNVRLEKPNLITASCIEGHLFKHLETRWKFSKPPRQYSPNEICLLDFYVSFEFKSLLYKKIASSVFDEMVRLNSISNIRMETICNPQSVVSTDLPDNNNQELKISNHHETLKRTNHHHANSSSNHKGEGGDEAGNSIKFKRCKHGRIIIKDSSKKKSVSSQQDDTTLIKDTLALPASEELPVVSHPLPSSSISPKLGAAKEPGVTISDQSQIQLDRDITENNEAAEIFTSTNNSCKEDLLKQTSEKLYTTSLKKPATIGCNNCHLNEMASSSKSCDVASCERKKEKSTDTNNSFERNTNTIRRSPARRRKSKDRTSYRDQKGISSMSPSHRKSPKRYRASKSSRRSGRKSRSPYRYDGSRVPWKYATTSSNSRMLSSKRYRTPSPKARRVSPRYQSNKQSARKESPSRQRSRSSHSSSMSISRSRSSSKSHTEYNLSSSSQRDKDRNRSVDKESIVRCSRNFAQDIKFKRVQDQTKIINPNNLDHLKSKDLPKQITAISNSNHFSKETNKPEYTIKNSQAPSEIITSQRSLQATHLTNILEHSNKSGHIHTSPNSPNSAQSSYAPSTDNSPSSEIYDPEGPIIPISPGDSPPLSPVIKTKAANNVTTVFHHEGEKNDDDVPSSAVELNHQEKYLQKLNRQERVVEEVKMALKPHYQKRALNKEQYKDVLRRAVPKICHSRNGEINPIKIRKLVDAYVKKMKRRK